MSKKIFHTTHGNEFACDAELFSALAKVCDKAPEGWGEKDIIEALMRGDFSNIARQIAVVVDGISYSDAYAKWFSADSESDSNIELRRGDNVYRMAVYAGDTYYQPTKSGGRQLREEARDGLREQLRKDLGPAYVDDEPVGYSLYMMAIRKNRDAGPKPEPKPEPEPEQPQVEVIRERVIERETTGHLEGLLQQMVCEVIANVSVNDMVPRIKQNIIDEFGFEPQVHEVVIPGKEPKKFQGLTHKAFDEVLFFIANDIPVYMYGPAGSGKNVLTEQVAKALDLDFYFMNSITDEYKITGFIDAGGTYHETEFYKAFTKGGVFFLDEMDASAPEVLVCLNAAIANRYFAFPTGAVAAHPDFRVVAAGNTLGTGADAMYTGRMQLDAATLNRFETVPVGYDERIDLMNADNDEELVEFIHGYRKALSKCGLASVASYRNIKMIKAAERAMSVEKALCYSLTKEMNTDDINTLVGSGELPDGNKYTKALKKVKSLVA